MAVAAASGGVFGADCGRYTFCLCGADSGNGYDYCVVSCVILFRVDAGVAMVDSGEDCYHHQRGTAARFHERENASAHYLMGRDSFKHSVEPLFCAALQEKPIHLFCDSIISLLGRV